LRDVFLLPRVARDLDERLAATFFFCALLLSFRFFFTMTFRFFFTMTGLYIHEEEAGEPANGPSAAGRGFTIVGSTTILLSWGVGKL
jgi:hypothetical protein